MKIVGVGCGPGMLTEQATQTIRAAHLIYGSSRAIDMAKNLIPRELHRADPSAITGTSRSLPDNAVVLSTGDPMLAARDLPGEVVPGHLIPPGRRRPASHLPLPGCRNRRPRE